MKLFNSFHPINVFTLELDKWEFEEHRHNFYELIFVVKGEGQHIMNNVSMEYIEGDNFFLTPEDAHHFIIKKRTTFIFLKFNEQIFLEKLDGAKQSRWLNILKDILQHGQNLTQCVVINATEKNHLQNLLDILLFEFKKNCDFSRQMLLELFGAVMMLMARSYQKHITKFQSNERINEKEKLNSILSYIRLRVYDAEKIKIEELGHAFHMSPNYISIYIKKHTGLSIQNHILQYKLKAAENLLQQSILNINEIALKLGFNDASHFNKTFKKQKGVSPKLFRLKQ